MEHSAALDLTTFFSTLCIQSCSMAMNRDFCRVAKDSGHFCDSVGIVFDFLQLSKQQFAAGVNFDDLALCCARSDMLKALALGLQ
eukprot:s575_g4.t1